MKPGWIERQENAYQQIRRARRHLALPHVYRRWRRLCSLFSALGERRALPSAIKASLCDAGAGIALRCACGAMAAARRLFEIGETHDNAILAAFARIDSRVKGLERTGERVFPYSAIPELARSWIALEAGESRNNRAELSDAGLKPARKLVEVRNCDLRRGPR